MKLIFYAGDWILCLYLINLPQRLIDNLKLSKEEFTSNYSGISLSIIFRDAPVPPHKGTQEELKSQQVNKLVRLDKKNTVYCITILQLKFQCSNFRRKILKTQASDEWKKRRKKKETRRGKSFKNFNLQQQMSSENQYPINT